MKSKKTKKFLCLLMVLTLLIGLLTGCHASQEDSATTTSTQSYSETQNTTYTTGGSCFPVETHPKIDDPWSNVHGYINNQLQENQIADQMSIKEYIDPFTGRENK